MSERKQSNMANSYTFEERKRYQEQQREQHRLNLTETQRDRLQTVQTLLGEVEEEMDITTSVCETCGKVSVNSRGGSNGADKCRAWQAIIEKMLHPK
jgi:hypothetical protein